MKLFACTNEDCKSSTPFDAETNQIAERIISDTPLDVDGNIKDNIDPEIVKVEYVCKRCGAKAIEVPLSKVMKARIKKVSDKFVYGDFKNKLRGDKIFEFRLNKGNGEVEFNMNSKKPEREYVREYYKLFYKKSIKAEVVHKDRDNIYEVEVYNKDEDITLNIYIKDSEIKDWDGDRKPNEIEETKSIKIVNRSPY